MRDKKFYIDSIKMDLYRVVTAVGDITRMISPESVNEFMQHAERDFNKMELTTHEKQLRNELKTLTKSLVDNLQDPHKRLRWTEDILTIRSRL